MDKSMPMPQPPGPGFIPPPHHAPPPAYDSQPQPPSVVYVGATQFGSESQRMTCPSCHASISTQVQSEPNMKTHLFALIFCVTGLWCCVCLPYCMDGCQGKKHYCPSCRTYLGEQN